MATKKVTNISQTIDNITNLRQAEDLSEYGREFQIKLIALLIRDRIFAASIIPIIKNEYFSDIYLRKIFVTISSYTEKFNNSPTVDNVTILLKEAGENMTVYNSILKSIENMSFEDRDFIILKSRQFCFSRHALIEQEKVKILLQQGDFETAKAISSESFRYSGEHQTKIYNLKKDYEMVFDEENVHNPIPTPFNSFNNNMKGGPGKGNLVIMVAESNFGKCFSNGTEVFMADMSIKNIEDIKAGDKVMGWDGKPRTVKSSHSGIDEMYRVDQNNGDSYTVNSRHELCIINSWDEISAKNIQIINPVQYLNKMSDKKDRKWRLHNRGFKSPGIDFKHIDTPFDPYILGAWLGDGYKSSTMICGEDHEVKDYLQIYCNNNGLTLGIANDSNAVERWTIKSLNEGRGENKFREFLKEYNLLDNKYIPEIFLKNSRENRLKLLAGLIDTDGGLGVLKTSVEITQKNQLITDGIVFLCRSLGLKVSLKKKEGKINGVIKGIYNRIIISGKVLVEVPTLIHRKKFVELKTKKDELKTKINITPVGRGTFYGFSIEEEDKMFLLADFTVVHNSNALIAVSRHANAHGKNVVFFSFEIGGSDMLRRHIAGLNNLKQEDVKTNRKVIEMRFKDEGLGEFVLIEERATNARIAVIKNHLEYLKSTGFFPDMICVDALNQLKQPIGMRFDNDNQKFEYLAEELRDMANDYELPVYTVMQTNRSGFNSEIVDIQAIGKAIEPFQVADVLITFSQTRAEANELKCKAFLVKNRLGKKNILLLCHYDPNMCVFDEIAVVDDLLLLTDDQKKVVQNTAMHARERLLKGDFDKKKTTT